MIYREAVKYFFNNSEFPLSDAYCDIIKANMTKRRTHKEIEKQIQNKLRKRFVTWFLIGSIGMMLFMLLVIGRKMDKENDLLIIILLSVGLTGLPLAFTMYWGEKWNILGYSTKVENIMSSVVIVVSIVVGSFTGNGLGISGIILTYFFIDFIANIIHKKKYKQDIENGTLPDINLDRLDNGIWAGYSTTDNNSEKRGSHSDYENDDDNYDDGL